MLVTPPGAALTITSERSYSTTNSAQERATMKLLALPLAIAGLVLALTLSGPIAERWRDRNQYQATIEAIEAADRAYQVEQTAATRAAGANAMQILLVLGIAAALWALLDSYKARRRPLARFGGELVARDLIADADPALLALLADKIRAAGIAQITAAQQPGPIAHSFNYSPRISAPAQLAGAVEQPLLAAPAPATVPSFASLLDSGRVGKGNPLVLGFDQDEGSEISGTWLDLYSTAIAGLPGTGKTTTQRFLACQTALLGARFAIIDPHAGAADDSLAATLAPLSSSFVCEPASDDKAILETVRYVADVGKRRITGKDSDTTPLILWADELTALLGRSAVGDELAELLERIAQEYRKRHVFVCGSGQIWTAARATSELRDSFASAIVHRMKRNQARMLLPTEEAATVERLVTGHAVLWRTSGATQTIAVPNTTGADVERVGALLGGAPTIAATASPSARPFGFQPARPLVGAVEGATEGASTRAPSSASQSPEAARILALFAAGRSISQIVKELWGVEAGRQFQERANFVTEVLRAALAGGAR